METLLYLWSVLPFSAPLVIFYSLGWGGLAGQVLHEVFEVCAWDGFIQWHSTFRPCSLSLSEIIMMLLWLLPSTVHGVSPGINLTVRAAEGTGCV